MRKPLTGEPCAGEPHARFGGRGGLGLLYPYQIGKIGGQIPIYENKRAERLFCRLWGLFFTAVDNCRDRGGVLDPNGYNSTMSDHLKPLHWVGSSKKDLLAMPNDVVDVFGFALHLAQSGKKHDQAKPLKGFGGASVLEVVEDHMGDT